MSAHVELDVGLVVTGHGRHCVIETPERHRLICHPRGKKNAVVVGDRVRWQPTGAGSGEGVIEAVEPRRNLLFRQDAWKTKSFAANLDQLLLWFAVDPPCHEAQLARALVAAEAAGIAATLVLNKVDLPGADAQRARLAPYRDLGYEVLEVSLKPDASATRTLLLPRLAGRATLVLGPSGTGKSTLINALVPGAQVQVGELSLALKSGRHTTTHTQWHWLADDEPRERAGALIDSPGFQSFGLQQIDPQQLPAYLPDIARHAGGCRFHNCSHRHEPACSVMAAVERGEIAEGRWAFYRDLRDEIERGQA